MLDNKIKKVLYKKILKKELALTSIDIDSNANFEAYKTQLIMINDCLIWYKSNFNKITYSTTLKIEYSGLALESTGGDIME